MCLPFSKSTNQLIIHIMDDLSLQRNPLNVNEEVKVYKEKNSSVLGYTFGKNSVSMIL